MIRRKGIVLLLLSCISAVAFSAPAERDTLATLRGRVGLDISYSISGMDFYPPAQGAVVRVYFQKNGQLDSLFSVTNREGVFSFYRIVPQRIALKVNFMGYEDAGGVYDISPGDNAFFFTLKEHADTITGAVVTAEVPLIKQIQDTTVYNTLLMQTMEDESLRSLLEMLPGFVVSRNSITVDGRPVSRTYVNGTLVFGDAVTTAIDALRADEVTQVKMYDELSDVDKHRGLLNGRKLRVLDIITKEAIISMADASAGLAGGADRTGQFRYATAGVIKFHSEMLQSGLMVDANNINTQGLEYTPDARVLLRQKAPLSTYNEYQFLWLDYVKYWKNRYYGNMADIDYRLIRERTKSASTALREYYGTDGAPQMSVFDSLANSSNRRAHEGKVRFKLDDTPLKSFDISINGKISEGAHNSFHGNLTRMVDVSDRRIHQDSRNDSRDYSVGASVGWTNNDTNNWRPFVYVSGALSNNTVLSWTVDTLNTSYLKRQLSSDQLGKGITAWVQGGTESTLVNDRDKTVKVAFTINSNYEKSKKRQLSLNGYGVETPVTDMANSFDFTTDQLSNSLDARMEYSTNSGKSWMVTAFLKDVLLLESESLPEQFDNSKHFPSLGASLSYYSPGFTFDASSSPVIPSVEHVRNRVSNSSPLSLAAGNPNLRQGYNIHFGTHYSPMSGKSGRSSGLSISFGGDVTLRPIVANVLYFTESTVLSDYDGYTAPAGSILNTFDNSSLPRVNLRTDLSYSGFFKGPLSFRVSLNDGYLRSPMNNGGSLSNLDENHVGISFRLHLKPSSLFMIDNVVTTAFQTSFHNSELLSSRLLFNDTFKTTWFITKRLRFDADYKLTGYKYLAGSGIDHFSHVLNSGLTMLIGWYFELGLRGYDILNSGSLYATEINSAMISQTWTPTYGRNIMLSFVYKFRKLNKPS